MLSFFLPLNRKLKVRMRPLVFLTWWIFLASVLWTRMVIPALEGEMLSQVKYFLYSFWFLKEKSADLSLSLVSQRPKISMFCHLHSCRMLSWSVNLLIPRILWVQILMKFGWLLVDEFGLILLMLIWFFNLFCLWCGNEGVRLFWLL